MMSNIAYCGCTLRETCWTHSQVSVFTTSPGEVRLDTAPARLDQINDTLKSIADELKDINKSLREIVEAWGKKSG